MTVPMAEADTLEENLFSEEKGSIIVFLRLKGIIVIGLVLSSV